MRNKKTIKSVLLLGSGALKIGEAGEFDYSGTQAIKALKEEGIRVILINPNIATVQTSAGLADAVYFLPVTPEFAARVIEKEQPEGILLSFGGQTALNCGLELEAGGILKKHNVKVLGTPIKAIRETEDRRLFAEMLKDIDLSPARGKTVNNMKKGLIIADRLGYPVMLRSGFALGGTGSGVANNSQELEGLLSRAFAATRQVIIEECLSGWKEIEYEVVRDKADNCLTVCNMENFDPVGIHTGESIVVAPSQTLTDREYYFLRAAAIRTIRKAGIVGECNIQFALNPENDSVRVIEVNARLSRSSALASKATGYPLAYVAAKLAIGKTLPELRNSVTGGTSAFFEPALDYIVVKMPRWDLDKFTHVTPTIGSEMKSVGEVMAIGRTFEEAVQKAARSLNDGYAGVIDNDHLMTGGAVKKMLGSLTKPDSRRIFTITTLLHAGIGIKEIVRKTGIDPWFVGKLAVIAGIAGRLKECGSISKLTEELLSTAKKTGFSDPQIAGFTGTADADVRRFRKKSGVTPFVKRIDTMAGEYPAKTNYLYFTYNAETSDQLTGTTANKALVIGCGPYSIGTSVEFDWCAVQAVRALRKRKVRALVINCNPETVSTDYDVSDELYFEELTPERILDVYDIERAPVIVSFGGQIPNSLVPRLKEAGIPVLGTKPEDIERAESRDLFGSILDADGILQPAWTAVQGKSALIKWISEIGYPVLIRPSYVLSGKAMSVVESEEALEGYLESLTPDVLKRPLVASKFLTRAREYDFDAVSSGGKLYSYVLSEHVEYGGVHSGDATMVLPPQMLDSDTKNEMLRIAQFIVHELSVTGPLNIQYLVHEGRTYVIECNLRASRSFPFVSKTTGVDLVSLCIAAMYGDPIPVSGEVKPQFTAVKVPQFSFHKLRGSDPVTTVEMNSTGEVIGLGRTVCEAYLSGIMATQIAFPANKRVFISLGGSSGKLAFLAASRRLFRSGYTIFATSGTGLFLKENEIPVAVIGKIHERIGTNVLELLSNKSIDFAVVIPERAHEVKRGLLAKGVSDGYTMRRLAVDMGIPVFTNAENAGLFVESILTVKPEKIPVRSMSEYVKGGRK